MHELLLVFGDQLDRGAPLFADGPAPHRTVVFVESRAEARRHPNHIQRVVLFLAGMRHFAAELRRAGWHVSYRSIADEASEGSLIEGVVDAIREHGASRVRVTEPGEWGIEQALRAACDQTTVTLDMLEDAHFLVSRAAFRT